MVSIRPRFAEEEMWHIRHDTQYHGRIICYRLGESARDTFNKWQESGFRDYIEEEFMGIMSEERQDEVAKFNINELLDAFFFKDRRFYPWQIFPEYRTKAMTDLEDVVIRTLETIPTAKEIAAGKKEALKEVYYNEKGMYLPAQHAFRKHGRKHVVDIDVDLPGYELGKFFFAAEHPGSGSPALYFDHRIIYNNAPEKANAYGIGGAKMIGVGKELEPNPSHKGRTTRRFMWSPICANTKIVPINLPEHTAKWEGFCLVPVKYFAVEDKVLKDIEKEKRK